MPNQYDEFWQDDIELAICRNDDIMVKKYKDDKWLVISKEDLFLILDTYRDMFNIKEDGQFVYLKAKGHKV